MKLEDKFKSVLIKPSLHYRLKNFCTAKRHTIGGIVERAIEELLDREGRRDK